MKVGDFIKLDSVPGRQIQNEPKDTWQVVSYDDETVTLKKKNIGGVFTFKRSMVLKVWGSQTKG